MFIMIKQWFEMNKKVGNHINQSAWIYNMSFSGHSNEGCPRALYDDVLLL